MHRARNITSSLVRFDAISVNAKTRGMGSFSGTEGATRSERMVALGLGWTLFL